MRNRLKELKLEKRLTLTNIQARASIGLRILESFEKELRNEIHNSLVTWQKLANFLEAPIEYLMGLNDDRKTLTINDLGPAKEDTYERITDMLCKDEDDEDE